MGWLVILRMIGSVFCTERAVWIGFFRYNFIVWNIHIFQPFLLFQIKFAQLQDAGTYECQISVPTGTISQKVQLHVFHPESYILVGNNSAPSYEFHVNQGSPITLTCTIPLGRQATPPQYIFWYQNQHMVNYDRERAVSVTTFSESVGEQPRTESKLTIAKAGKPDEGNYTCSPSNAEKATVVIFITRGKTNNISYYS